MSYNGYCNYETWLYKAYIDNDTELYNKITNFINKEAVNKKDIYNFLVETINKKKPYIGNNMYSALLDYTINNINFGELTKTLLEDNNLEMGD